MRIKWWYFLTLGIVFFDLLSKALLDGKNLDFISGFVSIVSVHNYGASFGVLSGAQVFFIIISILFAVGMILFDCLFKKDFGANPWYKIGFTLVLGGLLGNLFDRIAFGYVRDFIHLDFMEFAIFNIADIALTVGCICLAVFLIFFCRFPDGKKSPKNTEKLPENSANNDNLTENSTQIDKNNKNL